MSPNLEVVCHFFLSNTDTLGGLQQCNFLPGCIFLAWVDCSADIGRSFAYLILSVLNIALDCFMVVASTLQQYAHQLVVSSLEVQQPMACSPSEVMLPLEWETSELLLAGCALSFEDRVSPLGPPSEMLLPKIFLLGVVGFSASP